MKALGMIEVYGYLTAVAALDSALKTANVHLLNVSKVRGGLVTVLVTGDVGAVKAAVDAASSEAERITKIVSVHVIPRPADSIEVMLCQNKKTQTAETDEPEEVNEEIKEEIEEVKEEKEQEDRNHQPIDSNNVNTKEITTEKMQSMTVDNLRNLARQIGITNMTRKEIKFANKRQLIQSISRFLEQER